MTQSQDLSSPYKIFTRPALATVSGGGGRLNIENRHFILNWSWFKGDTRLDATGGEKDSTDDTVSPQPTWANRKGMGTVEEGGRTVGIVSGAHAGLYQRFNQACWFPEVSFTYSSLRLGRLSKRWLSMVVSLLWPRFLERNKKKKIQG